MQATRRGSLGVLPLALLMWFGTGSRVSADVGTALRDAERAAGGALRVRLARRGDTVSFLSAGRGRGIPLSTGTHSASTDVARAFVQQHGQLFGLRDADAGRLVRASATDEAGMAHLRLGQESRGLPVAGRTREGSELRYDFEMQIIDAGFVLTDEQREQLGGLSFGGLDNQRPGLFETFHVDDTDTELPAAATVLNARQLPPSGGGDTCFLDMRAAYDLLDPEMQRRLRGLRAVYAYNNHNAFPPRVSASGPNDVLVDVAHPIVRTHPVTGRRALYIDLDRATHVEGMAIGEGRALLQALQDHAEARAPRCRHRWLAHDVLVWDNASVQHKASGDFPVGEPRRFHRFLIAGLKPI